jgi:hypothetical protein
MECSHCQSAIDVSEAREHRGMVLCEDCYIQVLWPPVRKMYYENDHAEFMRRLKESYVSFPQQYH